MLLVLIAVEEGRITDVAIPFRPFVTISFTQEFVVGRRVIVHGFHLPGKSTIVI